MPEFHDGDVVRMKSGGPKMTIRFIERDEAVCDWFAGDQPKVDRFKLAQLTSAQPSDGRMMANMFHASAR